MVLRQSARRNRLAGMGTCVLVGPVERPRRQGISLERLVPQPTVASRLHTKSGCRLILHPTKPEGHQTCGRSSEDGPSASSAERRGRVRQQRSLTRRRARPAAPRPKCCHAPRRTTSSSPGRRWLQTDLRATLVQDARKFTHVAMCSWSWSCRSVPRRERARISVNWGNRRRDGSREPRDRGARIDLPR